MGDKICMSLCCEDGIWFEDKDAATIYRMVMDGSIKMYDKDGKETMNFAEAVRIGG